jgi:prophage maintenance system killer protein/prophage antirepressor-like protein
VKLSPEITLFRSKDGAVELNVSLGKETIWLSLSQLAKLFGRDKSVISRHFSNIFKTKELRRKSVVAKNATTAADGKTYQVELFNLDAIISVGYRVNSKRGTEFRIWATNILKQHLVQGYSVNEKRLKALQQSIKLASDISRRKSLSGDEATALLQTVSEYAYALDLLDDYDHQRVALRKTSKRKAKAVSYEEALELVEQMRITFGDSKVFGREKDKSLSSSLHTIMQSFDGKDLYPSVEEKAANLLYFLVKNHSFVDGNKRIAAAVFLRFADKNKLIYDRNGHKRVADNALVAMTLMIAESKPKEREVITAMVTNLIVGK